MSDKRGKGSAESYWPPPPRPVDDVDAAALRKLTIYCIKALTEKDGPKEPNETKEQSVRLWIIDVGIEGQFKTDAFS
jgi:hypothetical protein